MYKDATTILAQDFEYKPELLSRFEQASISRFDAVQQITTVVAPNFVRPGEIATAGQIAQGLSDWHRELADLCTERFMALTADEFGPQLSRSEANAECDPQTLQAIRRGVRAAMNNSYRFARDTSKRCGHGRSIQSD